MTAASATLKTASDLASGLSLVRLFTVLERRLFVEFLPVGFSRVLKCLAREQASRGQFVLLLPTILILASNASPVVREPSKEVLLLNWNLTEVKLVDVLILLARLDLINVAAKAVEARDEPLQVLDDFKPILLVTCEAPQNQVLVRVIKLVPVFHLVEVGEELTLRRIAQVRLLVTLNNRV